jgi:hypothetical protein
LCRQADCCAGRQTVVQAGIVVPLRVGSAGVSAQGRQTQSHLSSYDHAIMPIKLSACHSMCPFDYNCACAGCVAWVPYLAASNHLVHQLQDTPLPVGWQTSGSDQSLDKLPLIVQVPLSALLPGHGHQALQQAGSPRSRTSGQGPLSPSGAQASAPQTPGVPQRCDQRVGPARCCVWVGQALLGTSQAARENVRHGSFARGAHLACGR